MKKMMIAAGLLALATASPAFADATPFPSPSQGNACMVTWVGGACGHGPTAENGSPSFAVPPCRPDDKRERCDCEKRNS